MNKYIPACPDELSTEQRRLRDRDNPRDTWLAPEHARGMEQMRRPKQGIKDLDGTYLVLPGERIRPEPTVMRLQRQAEARARYLRKRAELYVS